MTDKHYLFIEKFLWVLRGCLKDFVGKVYEFNSPNILKTWRVRKKGMVVEKA